MKLFAFVIVLDDKAVNYIVIKTTWLPGLCQVQILIATESFVIWYFSVQNYFKLR